MFSALLLLAATQTLTLNPTDDIWVYHFAADQTSDPFLRCWGSDGKSSDDPNIGEAGSWSVMKFDISKIPTSSLTKAELNLYFVPNPNLDEAIGKKYPVNVRLVTTQFEEENFKNENSESIRPKPGKEFLLASAPVMLYANATGPTKVTINLGGQDGNFGKALKEARQSANKEIAFAITSALTPDEAGESMIYKFYSTNSEPTTKPQLVLTLD